MISQKRMDSFCRELIRRVRRYYSDKEHRKEFEEWYLKSMVNHMNGRKSAQRIKRNRAIRQRGFLLPFANFGA